MQVVAAVLVVQPQLAVQVVLVVAVGVAALLMLLAYLEQLIWVVAVEVLMVLLITEETAVRAVLLFVGDFNNGTLCTIRRKQCGNASHRCL